MEQEEKGTWGKAGDEFKYGPGPVAVDEEDPNYDSAEEAETKIPTVSRKVWFKEASKNIVEEYFSSGEWDDAIKSLNDLQASELASEFVKQLVIFALERKERERELTSVLLTHLYEDKGVGPEAILQAFRLLLQRVDDLVLDNPDAIQALAIFFARAVVDEVIPPAFLNQEDPSFSSKAPQVLELSAGMLKGKHVGQRLAHGWGPGDGKSVKRLKERVLLILEEYVSTRDLKEADKCVRELNSPSFHFYLVKRAIIMAVERHDKPKDAEALHELLLAFNKSQVVSQQQMEKGFKSFFQSLDDLKLDIPDAPKVFSAFADQAVKSGYLTESFRASLNQDKTA